MNTGQAYGNRELKWIDTLYSSTRADAEDDLWWRCGPVVKYPSDIVDGSRSGR